MSVISFDISGSQIDGARDYQEDAFLITHLGDADADSAGSMVIVADGMGGHAAGNVASNMAVQTFNRHLSKNFPNPNIASVLHEAVLQANGSITATVAETAALKGMGCTLVACVLERGLLRWASVGDSHLYLLRNGDLQKKNADHSYGGFLNRMAEAGTPVEAEAGFSRNMLMSALTGDDIAEIDCPDTPLELRNGDRVIISSDGLDTLAREKIIETCAGSATAKQCVDALLKAVDEVGAPRQDNTTVVIIDVIEKADPAPDVKAAPGELPRTAAEPARPVVTAASPTFPVDPSERQRNLGVIAALVAAIGVLGGGGAWYFMHNSQSAGTPPAHTSGAGNTSIKPDDGIIELDPVNPEPVASVDEGGGEKPSPKPEAAVPPPAPTKNAGLFRDSLRGGGLGPQMVWLPAGSFVQGNPLSPAADQRPEHPVTVAAFAIGVYEVTVAEYRRFASATGAKMPKLGPIADEATFPMAFVSWNEALAYAKWLSQQTGKDYSLPTESQWEYAARAGTDSAYWWGRDLGQSHAHCFACGTGYDPRQPTAIGRFSANKFGLFDTVGNVQEWVYDCYHPSYASAPQDGSVFEGGDCSVRVLRGGGYGNGPEKLTAFARDRLRVDKGNDQTGFRVIRRR